MFLGGSTTLDKFQKLHSEIIEYYQCIEHDMRRIYSSMSTRDYDECMDELRELNWGVILNKLKSLDKSDDNPYFTDDEYDTLDKMRTQRNYWCHQCYLDWVYIQDDWKREERLQRLLRQLENENNRAYKIHRKMQDYFINDFA